MSALAGKRILVGITGSIAAYKACELVRALRKMDADVTVAMSEAATKFVGAATFSAFTEHPVLLEQFPDDPGSGIAHVDIAESFDLVVVAPATANILGKAAHAVADELLATILNIIECPVIFVPAMNFRMWRNAATREAVARLRDMGMLVIDPDRGDLATMAIGEGRFPETTPILEAIETVLARSSALAGQRVLVTAGPTREPLDPVRYISNRSSGKMGYAMAAAARDMGAEVTLISGPVSLAAPHNCRVVSIETAADLLSALQTELPGHNYLIMAAAVSDFAPVHVAEEKMRRAEAPAVLQLQPVPDILRALSQNFEGTVVAFSLQADADLETARAKLTAKGADYIVVNNYTEPEAGFEVDTNHVWILAKSGEEVEIPAGPKKSVAQSVLRHVIQYMV